MAVYYQLVIDCTAADPLARFWAEALRYVVEPPPAGFDSWDDYYRSLGVPEDELGMGVDSIVDPKGEGPRIWFQVVPEKKSIKNRFHIDVRASAGRGAAAGGQARADRGRGGPTGGAGRHPAAHLLPGGHGPLRRRDARPRGQRVRRPLTRTAECVLVRPRERLVGGERRPRDRRGGRSRPRAGGRSPSPSRTRTPRRTPRPSPGACTPARPTSPRRRRPCPVGTARGGDRRAGRRCSAVRSRWLPVGIPRGLVTAHPVSAGTGCPSPESKVLAARPGSRPALVPRNVIGSGCPGDHFV